MKKTILICGGAGYIGSHTVRELLNTNYNIIVFDNLSKGFRESIPNNIPFIQGDVLNVNDLENVFQKYKIDAVMHFCAWTIVPESTKIPLDYYENNVMGALRLLQTMIKYGVKKFIFSSTAAIFGYPEKIPIEWNDKTVPINPYGETKLAVEKLLKWCDEAYGLKFICLRYFNACGAHESGEIGESHEPETHLIPIILQVALGKRKCIKIFGTDYKTRDGTCIRDYVHVTDLANAHILALDYLFKENKSDYFNLGSGNGYTVKEIIEACRKVTGHSIPEEIAERRPGDPDVLIASSEKAERILGWKRKYENIEDIVKSAWKWHQLNPNGFI